MAGLNEIRLVILDIDGVIYCNDAAAPGACEAIAILRNCGLMVKFLTNDAVNSRFSRAQELNASGFDVHPSDIYTAASLTAEYLRLRGSPRTMLLLEGDATSEFQNLPIVEQDPEAVVVGDCFSSYSFDKLNRAFSSIRNGAQFIATQRNRYCSTGGEPIIDVGFWVSGLEYCTGIKAEVIGKPSVKSYLIVCQDACVSVEYTLMVSDDLSSDLLGAYEAGLMTTHATDYSAPPHTSTSVTPDLVVSNLLEFAKLVQRRKLEH